MSIIGKHRRRVLGGGGFDADAADYFSRAESLDASAFDLTGENATATDNYTKTAHNELVRVLKGETASVFSGVSAIGGDSYGTQPTPINVWAKCYELITWRGVSFGAATAKLKFSTDNQATFNNFVGADYNATGSTAGLKGDGIAKYVNTEFVDNEMLADDRAVSLYLTEDSTIDEQILCSRGADNWTFFRFGGSGTVRFPAGDADFFGVLAETNGHRFVSRRSPTDIELFENGVSVGTNSGSAATANSVKWAAHCENFNGISFGDFTDGRITGCDFWQGLTTAEAQYVSWCLNAHATAFGANTYVNS